MPKNPESPASAAAAWERGRAGGPEAVAWLARAARLAPGDARVALDLAWARLGGDPARSAAVFEEIAGRFDVVPAWLGLALARLRLGEVKAAARALEGLLRRHCVPAGAAFAQAAAGIAAAAGYGGFAGEDAAGRVVRQGSGRLLGGRVDRAALARVDGLVAAEGGGLRGWAARPAAPDEPPALTLTDAAGRRLEIGCGAVLVADESALFLRRYRFAVSARRLAGLTPPFRLAGPDGVALMGCPVDPAALAACRPVPAARRGRRAGGVPRKRGLVILVPVYRGLAESRACLESLSLARPRGAVIIVVDDATPEPALAAYLEAEAAAGRIRLLRHAANRGFCAAVNTGFAAARGRDVLLLNSDTLVPRGAIETMRAAAYAAAGTGTVTPFSNEASICSYPDARGGNAMPDLAETERLNALAWRANGVKSVEIPTAVGSCMYIRHDCLRAVGGFRGEIFAQGYGEENDFCLRARHLGFFHRAATGAYVAHKGGVSFRAAARGLTARNLAILNRLYPGYHGMVMDFIAADPLATARARVDAAVLAAAPARDAVLMITHSHGGGVARQVAAQGEAIRAAGQRALELVTAFPDDPVKTPYPWPARLTEPGLLTASNLRFTLPGALPALLRRLRALRVRRVVLHHALGHHPAVREIAGRLGVPQDIVIHDYASFCPRINLLTPPAGEAAARYCGEPAVAGCVACCRRGRAGIYEPITVRKLIARSAAEFAAAASVTAPSEDAARRIARHFPGVRPAVANWEDDSLPVTLRAPPRGARRIAVIGGIGPSKGFDVLRACAEDAAARNLPLSFAIAGRSADDAALLATGRIFITGYYAEDQAQSVINELGADLAFLPSIWPETWCFALSEAWRAGLYTLAFDLGAQAARIAATGRGGLLPLGLPAPRINDMLLGWRPEKKISS